MASRNERRRRAKAKELALKQAVFEAERAEANKPDPIQDYSRPWCIAGIQKVRERTGTVSSRGGKRQFVSRQPAIVEPLKIDGPTGRGQRCKSWLTGRPK